MKVRTPLEELRSLALSSLCTRLWLDRHAAGTLPGCRPLIVAQIDHLLAALARVERAGPVGLTGLQSLGPGEHTVGVIAKSVSVPDSLGAWPEQLPAPFSAALSSARPIVGCAGRCHSPGRSPAARSVRVRGWRCRRRSQGARLMSDPLIVQRAREILQCSAPLTTDRLVRQLRLQGYVGSTGRVHWSLASSNDFVRAKDGWRYLLTPQAGARLLSPRQRSQDANGPYGFHRCQHIGRCQCRAVS